MKRPVFVLLAVAWLVAAPRAVSYIAFEQVSIAATAVGFTASKITPNPTSVGSATLASCRLELAQVRFTYDGTTPTTTVGTLLEVGDTLTITGHDSIVRFRAIRTTGDSGQLDCHYSAP